MMTMAVAFSFLIVYIELSQQFPTLVTQAGSEHNVSGWAWSANIGWVSFNCTNKQLCSITNQYCAVDSDCPVSETCSRDTCSTVNYGVNIDTATGNFSGYAWSSNIGWISFQETNPPDSYAFNANCSSTCNASNNCTACYKIADQKAYGWAKILTLGDNGWLKMNDSWANGVTINPTSSEFRGFAWNGNSDGSGIGWLSFSCNDVPKSCSGGTNPGAPCPLSNECTGGGSCLDTCTALSNYQAIGKVNTPPTAANLSAFNWNFANAGTYGALRAYLDWTYTDPDLGAAESAYQIIVDTDSNPASPILDTGKCLGYGNPISACQIDIGVDHYPLHQQISLGYNQTFYWWVQVWDNYDIPSALTQYNTSPDTDNDDGNALTFTIYKHEMPDPFFTWLPMRPSKGEEVKFTDASYIYEFGAPSTPVPCNDSRCDWFWTVPAEDSINDPATSTPIITFNSTGYKTVTLRVTDVDNYWTATSTVINIGVSLPTWREEKAY